MNIHITISSRWLSTTSPEKVLKEHIEEVEDSCVEELETTVASKTSSYEWNFILKSKKSLRAVALLQDAHRNHFSLRYVFHTQAFNFYFVLKLSCHSIFYSAVIPNSFFFRLTKEDRERYFLNSQHCASCSVMSVQNLFQTYNDL